MYARRRVWERDFVHQAVRSLTVAALKDRECSVVVATRFRLTAYRLRDGRQGYVAEDTVLCRPEVTFVLATFNRREVLVNTLRQVMDCGLPGSAVEVIVVDNASTDGTADQVRRDFPNVRLIESAKNLGSCAKSLALEHVRSPYTMFLDDDSYPRPGSVERMLDYFASDDRLGAAGFRVHLPDGGEECSAFPGVFIGCGVGLRTGALREIGGLDRDFFMQAEEYDVSFRLIQAGWRVRTFDDLHVEHLKSPQARYSSRTTFFDTRNNLLLIERYLPDESAKIYRTDWLQRYRWLAAANGHGGSFSQAVANVRQQGPSQRRRFAGFRLGSAAFETLFLWEDVERRMRELHDNGIRRIAFADLGKNVYAYHRGARETGLSVLGIADDRFFRPGRHYRGLPLIPIDRIDDLKPDAVLISNTSFVHAAQTQRRLSARITIPIFNWFGANDFRFSVTGGSVDIDATCAENPQPNGRWSPA